MPGDRPQPHSHPRAFFGNYMWQASGRPPKWESEFCGLVCGLLAELPDVSSWLGASGVVSENVEASLELARMALINAGVNEKDRDSILGEFRQTYRAQIDEV